MNGEPGDLVSQRRRTRETPPKDILMAQKCSYSRFENSGQGCGDLWGETGDLKDIPKSPRRHPGPERRPGSVALNSVDHLVPAPCKGTGETALSADDCPVHKSTGSQGPPAPTLEDRTSNHGASVVANCHPSCQSNGDADRDDNIALDQII
ncbi:hypothetical protein JRQ81_003413 [Phrynocephalus forsythii]|uniref:Uncharacterized protein n=1 Tax=Phrynocephalus forsythii TaxID=171643 RepID=A0A9Q1AX68_9SAUR|nr:hypothetical protein JRQ81_003413 [Phrynocephalus forsythii]